MDVGYEPSYSFSQQNNYASGSNHFPHYFLPMDHSALSSSIQSSELPSSSRPPHFPFGPPQPTPLDFALPPLVDYTIFNTPVDISLGTLPPRPTTSRALAQGRIPRPRNAFMLFRSAFHREKRLAKTVEKDHRHISRIIGLCWAELSEADKDVWRQKAELEKQQHALAYPDYRFKPTPRTKQPVKRNVKRNSPKEIERCHKIAKLIQTGKSGEELTHAVRRMEGDTPTTSPGGGTASGEREERRPKRQKTSDQVHLSTPLRSPETQCGPGPQPGYYVPVDEHPPFRSPLLPPLDVHQVPSKRPYPGAALESTCTPPTQQMINSHLEPADNLYFAPPYPNQDYIRREPERGTKYRQRSQGQPQQAFEWPTKDFPVTPYDAAFKQHYPESSHYSHYSAMSVRGPTHAPYTLGAQFVPGAVDWSTYYREEATEALVNTAVPTPSVYESWSNSTSNASASPVRSESPITAL